MKENCLQLELFINSSDFLFVAPDPAATAPGRAPLVREEPYDRNAAALADLNATVGRPGQLLSDQTLAELRRAVATAGAEAVLSPIGLGAAPAPADNIAA